MELNPVTGEIPPFWLITRSLLNTYPCNCSYLREKQCTSDVYGIDRMEFNAPDPLALLPGERCR